MITCKRILLVCAGLSMAAPLAAGTGDKVASPVTSQNSSVSQVSRMASGYLLRASVPDSLLLNPEPPAAGSSALARDEAAALASLALRGTPRWEQAVIDADLFSPKATETFSCAAGVVISRETTPRLNALMRRLGPDLGLSVYPTKQRYQRARPFMVNGEPTCTPGLEGVLRKDGSYPSGHSAIGYGWGLVLAEVIPDRAAQLVARGLSFGDSRRVCNVHWQSDIEEGRVVATAVVARLHADAAFRADVEAAHAEVDALRASAPKPDCARENAALAMH